MSLLTLDEAVSFSAEVLTRNQRLVLTNGIFDLMHLGHVDYLEKARALGDALIVGVNGDATTHDLKGLGRPFIPALERARLLAALRCVDATVIFDDLTADKLLLSLRPTIYAKGGDYGNKPLPESETAQRIGAQIVLIDYLPDHSTTQLIQKIRTSS